MGTEIRFRIDQAIRVRLRIYDVLVRLAADLINTNLLPGYHAATWQPSNAAQGVYFYRLIISQDRRPVYKYTEKMLRAK